jgi:hypothetical protein
MRNEFPAQDSPSTDLALTNATTQPSEPETAQAGDENAANQTVVTELPADDAVPDSEGTDK